MSAATPASTTVKELTQDTLQANKDHQYALKVYTERLEAELEAVDKLLAAAEAPDDEIDVDVGGHITIAGAAKASGPIPSEIAPDEYPFAKDAEQRQKYLRHTTIHPMKASDLEALADAVRSENHRLHALEAQKRGQQPFVALNDHPQSYFEQNKEGINWERVAQKVTAAGSNPVHRTAQECEIRWLGERHPDFDRSPWSQSEISNVKQLVGNAKEGEIDWVDIAAKLGTGRTPIDCMRHAIPRKMHVWTPESDQRLLEMVKIYGNENWHLVARQVSEDVTATQCQSRYTRALDPVIRRGPWAPDEDDRLQRAVEIFGRSWTDVCTFVITRSNEQCRDRWQDALNPTVGKGRWTESEDQALLAAYGEFGDRWKDISQKVAGGRTDNMCRHRYNHLMKRKLKRNRSTTSPAPGETSISTPEPVAGPSHPPQAGSRAETPSTEASGTPAPHKPKPKPRPRTRRVTVQPEGEVRAATAPPSEQREFSQPTMTTTASHTALASSSTNAEDTASGNTKGENRAAPDSSTEPPTSTPRGPARPGKRLQGESEAQGEPATKKKRTRKGLSSVGNDESGLATGAEERAERIQSEPDGSSQAGHSSALPQLVEETEPVRTPGSSRGRKKRTDPTLRPAPTRRSVRLRNQNP